MAKRKQRMAPLKDGKMIQEIFRHDPWKLLVGCMMLNQTTGVQVHEVIYDFFAKYPDPTSVMNADPLEMQRMIMSLGLYKRRTDHIIRMSADYVRKQWRRPEELTGIGKYGQDSYDIFILDRKSVRPKDKELKAYLRRIKQKGRCI